MSPRPTPVDERVAAWLAEFGWREHAALARLREATDALPEGGMRSSTEQVGLLAFLIELMSARQVLEIGCFTGYGTLAMALAVPEDGRVVTLDANDTWPAIGRSHWQAAGVERRIELRVGLAADSLDGLVEQGRAGSFDLAYVDADKKGYELYFERALALVRAGGVVALDNVLWKGAVADATDRSRQTEVLRGITRRIHADPRVTMVLLPLGDGLLLTRRR